jgi:hypothetical protein
LLKINSERSFKSPVGIPSCGLAGRGLGSTKKGHPATTQKIPFPGLTAANQYVTLAIPFSRFASAILSRIVVIGTSLIF